MIEENSCGCPRNQWYLKILTKDDFQSRDEFLGWESLVCCAF